MDNHSMNESSNHSALLGTAKKRLQPLRITELLEEIDNDDEDSEPKDDDDSMLEDVEQLPSDGEAGSSPSMVNNPADGMSPITEENTLQQSSTIKPHHVSSMPDKADSSIAEKPNHDVASLQRHNFQGSELIRKSESMKLIDNSYDEQRKSELQRLSSIPLKTASVIPQVYCKSSALISTNRRSNVKFEVPELPILCEKSKHNPSFPPTDTTHPAETRESNQKQKYISVSGKSDAKIHSSQIHSSRSSGLKIEASEASYHSNHRHSQPPNVATSESSLSAASNHQTPLPSHLITDTPLKNNPPIGSSRPTPSVSHRSMFQTPQSSKFHDYSKNNVQTPATIFGNWSQNHMVQTPLQNLPVRSQSTSILGQHSYRNTEDKDRPRRKPLGESIQSNHLSSERSLVPNALEFSSTRTHDSGDHQNREILVENVNDKYSRKSQVLATHSSQHSSEKPQASYALESSVSPRNPESGENENRGVPENDENGSSKKHTVLGTRESKENRLPQSVEKPKIKEEPPKIRHPESMKEALLACSNPTSNENRPDLKPKVGSLQISDSQGSQRVRSNSERKPNVQLSIPSSIQKSNYGEMITVKGKKYFILGALGQGMSGEVLRVQDMRSRELRAIKIVDLKKLDSECAQGCLQEISMLHKLQAPCVVKMFDYEIEFPTLRVVMEMGDTDLRSLLNSMPEKNHLPLTMILYYWTEILTAVKHIHDNGVIHSDLKPANFLLVRGRLKLIDFGIASSMNADMTSVVKNSTIGTMNYISPEALMDIGGNGGASPNKVKYKITFKSDVWSLGCILYSFVYGQTPFQQIRNHFAKMHAITNPNSKISYAMPAGSNAEPPPSILIDVMRKCLQHDPKARPTVADLLKVPYVPKNENPKPSAVDIPPNILVKIKNSLTESEWREFTNIMGAKRNQS